jgi:predicted RNA binding protein YcfA (HicA-like mRNA interferase family)
LGKNHPSSLHPRVVDRILKQAGARDADSDGKGDHKKYHYWIEGRRFTVVVDQGDDIPEGTLMNIAKQAQIDKRVFWELFHDPKMVLIRGLPSQQSAPTEVPSNE